MSLDLFSQHPITWASVRRLYGENAQVNGVKEWYTKDGGWKEYPATTAMATKPEDQVLALANAGAHTVQLYVDVPTGDEGFFHSIQPDFLISELLQPTTETTTPPEPPAVIL